VSKPSSHHRLFAFEFQLNPRRPLGERKREKEGKREREKRRGKRKRVNYPGWLLFVDSFY
jgi:hypothetical protein